MTNMNKQLEKDLKQIILKMKPQELRRILSHFEDETGIKVEQNYSKKARNCISCQIKYAEFTAKGYGRKQEESFSNAVKNLFDNLIMSNYAVAKIKNALKVQNKNTTIFPTNLDQTEQENLSRAVKSNEKFIPESLNTNKPIINNKNHSFHENDQTINLDHFESNDLLHFSKIGEIDFKNFAIDGSCDCVYYHFFQQNNREIKNLKARMQLLAEQNQILRSLLLKDCTSPISVMKTGKGNKIESKKIENTENKQNLGILSNE